MSKKKKQQQKKQLDLELIQKHTAELGMAALTGRSIPTRSIQVTVELPEPMVAIAEHVAAVTESNLNDALSQMVKEGLSIKIGSLSKDALKDEASLESLIPKGSSVEETKKAQDIFTNFTENISGIQDLITQLNSLEQQFTNGTFDPGNLPKIK